MDTETFWYVKADEVLPYKAERCPECGGRLYLEFDEWETETGKPTEVGVHVRCRDERPTARRGEPGYHRFWQSDWQDVITAARRWAQKYVRITDP